jgi:transmembrane sensor
LADSGDTQLILGGQRLINLRQDNANLIYGKDGSSIQIDSTSVVEQVVSADQQFNTLIVPYGKRSSLTLSDGTRIWLNSGSKLVYPAKFAGKEREVYLEGQAYFSVSHSDDVPFFVHTREMKVKVLGTEFDISAYEDDHFTSAVLASGSIELSIPQQSIFGAKKTKITPGTRAVFQSDQSVLKTEQVDVREFISWKDGYLILEKAPLGDILKKLSRYYRVDITLKEEDLEKVTFSGTLHLQDDIQQVLDIVATTTSLNYKQQSKERRYVLEKSAIRP